MVLQEIDRKFRIREKAIKPHLPRANPDLITLSGLVTGPLAGYFLWTGNLPAAAAAIILNAAADLVDGMTARKYGLASKRGSLLDDVADRTSDISIAVGSGGLAGNPFLGAVAAAVLLFSSYLSLQGLALYGKKAKFGIFSRANRTAAIILLLLAGIIFGFNPGPAAVWLSIAAGLATIAERLAFLLSVGRARR